MLIIVCMEWVDRWYLKLNYIEDFFGDVEECEDRIRFKEVI